MAKVTVATGVVLILLGIGFYIGIGEGSVTALIPALFGLPIFVFGLVALNPARRKHAVHGALVFALLGLLGSVSMGFRKWIALAQGVNIERPLAAWEQLAMAVVCFVFIALAVRSFIAARTTMTE